MSKIIEEINLINEKNKYSDLKIEYGIDYKTAALKITIKKGKLSKTIYYDLLRIEQDCSMQPYIREIYQLIEVIK